MPVDGRSVDDPLPYTNDDVRADVLTLFGDGAEGHHDPVTAKDIARTRLYTWARGEPKILMVNGVWRQFGADQEGNDGEA